MFRIMRAVESDSRRMALALTLAEGGLYSAAPNPRVGCAVFQGGEVVGRGWHEAAGGPHAETLALSEAGKRANGADVFVSLEPCAHSGKTPPCADALIRAKPARVVAAMPDPDPRVCGKGFAKLREAGVKISCGVLRSRALELNCGFASRHLRGRPWLRLKIAATLDGRTALHSGLSKWITGKAARTDAHHFRARSCAVLTGIGTAQADDPRLTARHVATSRQPLRILLDRELSASPELKMLSDGAPTLVVCAVSPPMQMSKEESVELLCLPDPEEPRNVNLTELMKLLASRGINEVTVEAGRKLCGAFLRAGLVDEVVVYFAPKIFGEDARSMFALPSPDSPDSAAQMELADLQTFGGDIRATYRNPASLREMNSQLG